MPNESNDLPPPVNHVFVDYENVQEIDLAVIGNKTVHFTLLLGPRQTKLDVALVEKLLRHAATVEIVRLTSASKNALDFTLAYYLGRAVTADPTGYFHIVSKDTGFDPLIEHLRSKHIRVRRHEDFTKLSISAAAKSPPPLLPAETPAATSSATSVVAKPVPAAISSARSFVAKPTPVAPVVKPTPKPMSRPEDLAGDADKLLEYLYEIPNSRPIHQTVLHSHVMNLFRNEITRTYADRLFERLQKSGNLKINARGEVTYHF